MSHSRSSQPRKQRKATFNASSFTQHRQMTVSLSRELRAKYGRRALPLRKGDTVRIISGNRLFKGREERVSKVDLESQRVTLDNVTIKKVDQKLKPLPIRTTHLILTRLNLTDPWRREILHVTAAEAAPEEAAPVSPETPSEETALAPTDETPRPETPDAEAEDEEPKTAPAPAKKRRAKSPAPEDEA